MTLQPDFLVQPERWLAAPDADAVRCVHVGGAEGYADAHLPDAVLVTPELLRRDAPPAAGELPAIEELGALGALLGLTEEPWLLIYDDASGGGWAGRLIWTLDVLGYPRYRYLNGGLRAWHAAGGPLRQGPPPPPGADYHAQTNAGPQAGRAELLSRLGDPELTLWDVRSREEYTGARCLAKRGGHIPGAVHRDWLELMDRNHRLRDLEVLRAELAGIGLDGSRDVVTYCQAHRRSGLSYLVGKLLGWRIRAYAGAWSEWGNRDELPVASGDEPGGPGAPAPAG